MEKTDSMATVTIKEYPDNVSYTTEAPPAYKQPRATAVQVAKIAAVTVIVASAILGSCILASAWIQSRATCELLLMEQQLQLAQQQLNDNPSFQALVQEPRDNAAEESSTTTEKVAASESQENSQQIPIRLNKVPMQIDFDDLAGHLMDNNQRAHMNCVVEKRRSEELVDHAPREVALPFGLNLTTPPRLEHLTGEKMVISCESGRAQERQMPPPPPPPHHAVPLMIPLPGGPIHLPLNFAQHSNDVSDSHPMEHIEMIVAHPFMEQQHHHHQQQQQQQAEPSQMREMRMAVLQEEPIMPQEMMRPHYVHPRSVPSQPDFLTGAQQQQQQKRKRCACDCNC